MLKANRTKVQSRESICKGWEKQLDGRRELDEFNGYWAVIGYVPEW